MLKFVLYLTLLFTLAAHATEDGLPKPPPGTRRTVLGFKLTHLDSGSIYETVGLREGDIIKTLNGRTVKTASDIMELPPLLKRDKKVELQIERNDQNFTLIYRIKTVQVSDRDPSSKAKSTAAGRKGAFTGKSVVKKARQPTDQQRR